MNPLAINALEYWKMFRPTAYSLVGSPERYFTELVNRAEDQIAQLCSQIAGNTSTAWSGRSDLLHAARLVARMQVLQEIVFIPAESSPTRVGKASEAASTGSSVNGVRHPVHKS